MLTPHYFDNIYDEVFTPAKRNQLMYLKGLLRNGFRVVKVMVPGQTPMAQYEIYLGYGDSSYCGTYPSYEVGYRLLCGNH